MFDYITVQQTYKKDLTFWRPTAKRIYNDPLWTSVSQVNGISRVSIPVTTRAVQRTNGYAAYLRYPFFFEPTVSEVIPPAPYVTSLVQGYPDEDGVVTPRVATIYELAHTVVRSDGNPSPAPAIEVGDILLVEGSTNNGGVTPTTVTADPIGGAGYKPTVGVFGQAVVGRKTFSDSQDIWLVGGNSDLGSVAGFDPKNGADCVTVTKAGGSYSLSPSFFGGGVVGNLFSTYCVIEAERYLDTLLVVGGMNSWASALTETLICDKVGSTVTVTTPIPESTASAAAISIPVSGAVLVSGGFDIAISDSKAKSYFFNPYDEIWTETTSLMITPRRNHQMIGLDRYRGSVGNFALVVGGRSGVFSTSVEHTFVPGSNTYVLLSDTFRTTGSEKSVVIDTSDIPVNSIITRIDATVVVPFSGEGSWLMDISFLHPPASFDPEVAASYSKTGLSLPGNTSIVAHIFGSFLMALALGGTINVDIYWTEDVSTPICAELGPVGVPINKCEVIDITTEFPGEIPANPFVSTGNMSDARFAFGMTKLRDGRVLVCGGIGWNPNYPQDPTDPEYDFELSSCEIFDPDTGFWTPIQRMIEPHSYCTCTYVPTANKVYVYGGYTSSIVEYLDLETMLWHKSVYQMPAPIVAGSPFGLSSGFMGVVGGGTRVDNPESFTVSPLTWESSVVNVPEYARYDGLNAEWRVDAIVGDTITLSSPSLGNYANTSVRWSDAVVDNSTARFVMAKAVASSEIDLIGPFSFDTQQPFVLSDTNLVLAQEIQKGACYGTLQVASGAFSIEPGYLLFNYGESSQVGPVRCLGATDDTTLQVHSGFKFPVALDVGARINVLYQKGSYVSESPEGAFWLTASNVGKQTAINLLKSISAAGIQLDISVRYPGDRGLGGEGYPVVESTKLSDIVMCFGRDDVDMELEEARTTILPEA